jgi:hypothetical protein
MSISALFKELGAPLHNVLWSWGAVRNSDNSVFLRVWQDGTKKFKQLDGRYYTWLCDEDDKDKSNGAIERRGHVALIENGSKAYLIMCKAQDEEAQSRTICGFDDETLHVGGELIRYDGGIWIANIGKRPVREIRL